MDHCDVAVVGAGPFGLSAGVYLHEIKGLETRVFGQPMGFWQTCMPPRMLLRSHWHATHIAAPRNRLTLDAYTSQNGNRGLAEPIPVREFIRYGQWFHDQSSIQSDHRKVVRVERASHGHELTLDDGSSLSATRVLIATGIESYAYKPDMFGELPRELASHASELRDYNDFKGKEVIVIGGGQSALESAAFLHEGGARVEILVRARSICHRRRFALLKRLVDSKRPAFLYGRGGVGAAGISLLIQQPDLYARLSPQRRVTWDRKSTKLGFSYRLVPDMNGTSVRYGNAVCEVSVRGERLNLRLSDGSERTVDHAVLGTGYRVDVRKCALLGQSILNHLRIVDGYPLLDGGLESSVRGLHFLGAPAAYSFGPLLRFVAGTEFASSAVARRIRNTHEK